MIVSQLVVCIDKVAEFLTTYIFGLCIYDKQYIIIQSRTNFVFIHMFIQRFSSDKFISNNAKLINHVCPFYVSLHAVNICFLEPAFLSQEVQLSYNKND